MESYHKRRLHNIDTSEWFDIYRALKALGAKRGDKILELGAGCGLLARYLHQRGFRVIGVDIDCSYWLGAVGIRSENPPTCIEYDLNRWEEIIPRIIDEVEVEYVVSQHVLEHLDQDKAKSLLGYLSKRVKGQVHIVPGHLSDDKTHVINHYHKDDLVEMLKQIRKPYSIYPDSRSYISPEITDYIIIVGLVTENRISALVRRRIRNLMWRLSFMGVF